MPVNLNACLCALLMLTSGCTGIPDNVSPVSGFDVNRYLGTWYEIARLDHSVERGLEQVSAEYSLRDDGGIQVVNQGYDRINQRWEKAEGKAYFIGDSDVGRLKVSFFGPFYGGYNIIDLESPITDEVLKEIESHKDVIRTRTIRFDDRNGD